MRWGHSLRVLGWQNISDPRPFTTATSKMDLLEAFFTAGGHASRSKVHVFLDGYDTIVQASPRAVLSQIAFHHAIKDGREVLFSGEAYCAPKTRYTFGRRRHLLC